MSKITDQIERDVNAELVRIAKSGDPALAQVIRERIGSTRTWTKQTVQIVRTEEQQGLDGRAG